jgi:hypothetical protein
MTTMKHKMTKAENIAHQRQLIEDRREQARQIIIKGRVETFDKNISVIHAGITAMRKIIADSTAAIRRAEDAVFDHLLSLERELAAKERLLRGEADGHQID